MASTTDTITEGDITLLEDPRKRSDYESHELEQINETVEKIKLIGNLICDDESDLSYSKAGNIPFNREVHVHNIWIKIWHNDHSDCKKRVFYSLGLNKPKGYDHYIFSLWMDFKHTGGYKPSQEVETKRNQFHKEWEISTELGVVAKESREMISGWKDSFKEYARAVFAEVMKNEITDKVLNSFNAILTGAPGTGKTYLAKEVAANIVTDGKCVPYDNLTDDQKKQIDFVQFHPSYDYTDFVEGLRSYDNNGQIGFRRQDGIFKKFCKQALEEWKNPSGENAKKYVFIIDEINRGELSKIFGELFYSIDPGYRGEKGKVKTQYQNLVDFERDEHGDIVQVDKQDKKEDKEDLFIRGFYVPKNVYIIGTMNEIDRSVEPMDFAVRRRFQWIDIKPEDRISMWGNKDWCDRAKKMMHNINSVIRSIEALGEPYCLGPAYFKDPPLDEDDEENPISDDLWIYRIEPILKEYVRILPKDQADDYMATFKKAYHAAEKVKGEEYEKIKNELKNINNGKK